MRFDKDTADEILATITKNKSRSLLTAFGVFWGIFMLVVLMGGGKGLQEMMMSNFTGFATNSGMVFSSQTGEAYKGFRKGRWWGLRNGDLETLRQNIPEIDVATSSSNRWGNQAVYGDKSRNCNVQGYFPEYDKIAPQTIRPGRFINEIDIRENRKVCVIGKRVYEQLFAPGEDPLGKQIKVGSIYFTVIGVAVTEGDMNVQGRATEAVILPATTFQLVYNKGDFFDVLCYTVKPGYRVSDVQKKVDVILKRVHYIAPTDQQAVMFINAENMFSMMNNLFIGIRLLVLLVGAGTLLAGIIGVSNIMMVTVKERTVEIGIRRAIGAQPTDIMQQIMLESLTLTLIAGMFGIMAAVGVLQLLEGALVSDAGQVYAFQVGFGAAIGTCILVAVLGVLAGLAPAYRAMAVKPIEAIRDE